MIPLLFTVIEVSTADTYGVIALQASGKDGTTCGDVIRVTVDLATAESVSTGDQYEGITALAAE